MEDEYILDNTKSSTSGRLMSTNNSQTDKPSSPERPLTAPPIERKLCMLCQQEFDSPNYADHVEICNGEESFLSTPVPLSKKQNLVYKEDVDDSAPHHQLCAAVDDININTGCSTPRTVTPPAKVKLS
jgi:hypothetical protein